MTVSKTKTKTTKAQGKPTKATKPTNQPKSNEEPKMTTMSYDLGEAEDFKLPSAGVHLGNLAGVEQAESKKSGKAMTVVTVTLSPEDPDAPNLSLRKYLTWPIEEDRDKLYGTRNAFGAQLQSIKEVMIAFGGKESGAITPTEVLAFLDSKIGMAVKVKVKQEARKDQVTGEPLNPPEFQANVDKLLPA
jgi:hypothetical protein